MNQTEEQTGQPREDHEAREDQGVVAETKKAMTVDKEVPIDKKAPGSTFSLVALSYMSMLVIVALVLAAVLWSLSGS